MKRESPTVYCWHSERWTTRNEALMEAVRRRVEGSRSPNGNVYSSRRELQEAESLARI